MSNKDIFSSVKSLKDLERRRLELEARYKREEQKIKNRDKMLGAKLNTARTHMVMTCMPQLIKVLGYSHLLNISLEDINSNSQILEKLQGEKNFNAVFGDLENVIIALTDVLYNRNDIREELQKLISDMTGLDSREENGNNTEG